MIDKHSGLQIDHFLFRNALHLFDIWTGHRSRPRSTIVPACGQSEFQLGGDDTHLDTLRSAAFVDTRLKLRRGDLGRTRRADIIRRSIRHIRSDVPGIRAADRDLSHYGTYPFDGILSTGRLRIHRSRHYNDRRRYFSVGDLQDNQIDRLTAGLGRCRLET